MTELARRVPASFFGMVLGLCGLGQVWRAAHAAWGLPAVVGEAILLAATLLWLVLTSLFTVKWLTARAEAMAELDHPLQGCFIGLAPVATLLIAVAVRPYGETAGLVLLLLGLLTGLPIGLHRTGRLWRGGRPDDITTPAIYLPLVGICLIGAVALTTFGLRQWAEPALGAGILSWLAIDSLLLARLHAGAEMPPALRPTLGFNWRRRTSRRWDIWD